MENRIEVYKDFSETPGPRYRSEGTYSGQEFRENILLPQIKDTISQKGKLTIILDGAEGYGTSFLEEAFGGLIRNDGYNLKQILDHIEIISTEEEYLKDDIISYLQDAEEEKIKK